MILQCFWRVWAAPNFTVVEQRVRNLLLKRGWNIKLPLNRFYPFFWESCKEGTEQSMSFKCSLYSYCSILYIEYLKSLFYALQSIFYPLEISVIYGSLPIWVSSLYLVAAHWPTQLNWLHNPSHIIALPGAYRGNICQKTPRTRATGLPNPCLVWFGARGEPVTI